MNNSRIYYSEEAENRMKRQSLVTGLILVGLGVGIGSMMGALLAPKKSALTPDLIASTLEDGVWRGRQNTQEALSQLDLDVPELGERVNEFVDKITP